MSDFEVWTDGGCRPNPGIGGYGIIIMNNTVQDEKEREKEIKQGFIESTNNRMELLAVIEALKKIPEKDSVKLYTDSTYVVGHFKGDKRSNNHDLWKLFDEVMKDRENVDIVKVEAQHEEPKNKEDVIAMNSYRCDRMVHEAREGGLIVDEGYEPKP